MLYGIIPLNINDWIGFAGVTILLLAFLLNLLKKISSNSLPYIVMNIIGAGLAWWLIDYIPFVILEAAWMLVSVFGLFAYFRKKDLNR